MSLKIYSPRWKLVEEINDGRIELNEVLKPESIHMLYIQQVTHNILLGTEKRIINTVVLRKKNVLSRKKIREINAAI